MNDPYQTLGVSPSASDDEIKDAYRALARQYHPDRFSPGDPGAAEAEEKMKEINDAYDEIVRRRSQNGGFDSSPFSHIRTYLSQNNFAAAESELQVVGLNKALVVERLQTDHQFAKSNDFHGELLLIQYFLKIGEWGVEDATPYEFTIEAAISAGPGGRQSLQSRQQSRWQRSCRP